MADKEKGKESGAAAPAAGAAAAPAAGTGSDFGSFSFSGGFGAIAAGTSSGWSFGTGSSFGGTDSGFGAFTVGATSSSAEDTSSAGTDKGAAADENPEEENQTRYVPVVQLKTVEVDSGEKDENEVYKHRCALFRHAPGTEKDAAQWKERGRGDIRFLQHKVSKMVRVILREEKTLKLRLNHVVHPKVELKPNAGSDRFWAWRTEDFAEEPPTTDTFGIKFKTPEIANEFKAKWDSYRKENETAIANKDKAAPAAAAAATAAAGAAPEAKKTDAAVDALAAGVSKVAIDSKSQQENLWSKIIADRKFAPLTEDDIKKLWQSFDTNNDNKIDKTELKALLSALLRAVLKQLQVPVTDDVQKKMEDELPTLVQKAITRLDTNKDGTISWDEFRSLNEVKMVSSA